MYMYNKLPIYVTAVGMPWRRGLVVSSRPATEQIGAMGREIESRQGKGWKLSEEKNSSGHTLMTVKSNQNA
jgi:hypothetical protein